jgi:hypothetical protein
MPDGDAELERIVRENREFLTGSALARVMHEDIEPYVQQGILEPFYLKIMPPEGYFGFYRVYHVHSGIKPTIDMLKQGLKYHWSAPLNGSKKNKEMVSWDLIGNLNLVNASLMLHIAYTVPFNHISVLSMSDKPEIAFRYFVDVTVRTAQLDAGFGICKGSFKLNPQLAVQQAIYDMKKSHGLARISDITGLDILHLDTSVPTVHYG